MTYSNVISQTVIETTLRGREVKIEYRIMQKLDGWCKARAYVSFPNEFSGAWPDPNLSAEEDAKAWKAYNRQQVAIMREIIGLLGADASEWSFSRKAGCGCGCSPGFIRKNNQHANRDHYVKVRLAD